MLWEEILDKAELVGTPVNNIFQEEMQKGILTALSRNGCFDHIVFQGGTALKLFYGNPRFSEDIDLVLKKGMKKFDLSAHISNIERFCIHSFPFLNSVRVTKQKDEPVFKRYILQTAPEVPDQKLRLHIELASVPSYHNGPRILDFPPINPAVAVEDADEILADKICAVALRPYLKGRDLWDIYFLTRERSVEMQWKLVEKKVKDYNHDVSELDRTLRNAKKRINKEGKSILKNELKRFLPENTFDQFSSRYKSILDSVVELIAERDEQKRV